MKKIIQILQPKKEAKLQRDIIPKGVKHTVVPKEFETKFPNWDKNLFNNIKYI